MPLPGPAAGPLPGLGPAAGWGNGWRRTAALGLLALVYLGAARIPLPSGLAFQAYLFWPAAAVAHIALFILGPEAVLGIAVGSLALNLTGWLPWPSALAMSGLQTLEPLLAWRLLVALGSPHPDLRRLPDLLRWLGAATLVSALCSAGAGTWVVGLALPGGFRDPWATALSWFLGDLTALLCLGPVLLLFLAPAPTRARLPHRPAHPWLESLLLGAAALLLLFSGQVQGDLPRDFRLAFQFALLLPVLWLALRLGPRATAVGTALLSLAFLASLWTRGRVLPEEAFRFSQLYLLVLALAAHITAVSHEEARLARHELGLKELQAQRMEAVGTLAGGLVHEFNNRLTVLLGNLDRLRDQALDGEPAALVDRLEASTLALEDTVRQLKDLSHQAPVRAFPMPLREALAPFLASASGLPDRIAFSSDVPADLQVDLDPDLLRQVLQLLLTNSLEAIEGRGRIVLRARRVQDRVVVTLEDDGRGMTAEVLQRACDPFFSTKPVGQGRGLGLSIAFSLVRQMGGELGLDSHPGLGTRAELRFPLGPEPAPSPDSPSVAPLQARILLADDEAAIRELTRDCLEGEGFHVREAADGLEALELFEGDPGAWDLVILDLVMPRMHGAEVLARIHARRPDLPVLLISGYTAEARPELLQGPHRRFLAKPFRLRELLAEVAALGLQPPSAPRE